MTDDSDLPTLQPVAPGLYRHYKGGWYEVQDTVRCSETLQPMVVYRALYGSAGKWVRPAGMFAGEVSCNGQQVPRFARHDASTLIPNDLATAHALTLHLGAQLQQHGAHAVDCARTPHNLLRQRLQRVCVGGLLRGPGQLVGRGPATAGSGISQPVMPHQPAEQQRQNR
jgi:hypothetical protein